MRCGADTKSELLLKTVNIHHRRYYMEVEIGGGGGAFIKTNSSKRPNLRVMSISGTSFTRTIVIRWPRPCSCKVVAKLRISDLSAVGIRPG